MKKSDWYESAQSTPADKVQPSQPQVGERYELQKLLGSGSFSSVCCCLDTVTGERVWPRPRPSPKC